MSPSSSESPAAAPDPAAGSLLQATTGRFIAAVAIVLGIVFFFHMMPGALRWPGRILLAAVVIWLVLAMARAALSAGFSAKKVVFSLILGGFFYLALHLMCHVFLKLMAAKDDRVAMRAAPVLGDIQRSNIQIMLDGTSFKMYDPDVGWVPRPGSHADGTINQQGVRSLRDYAIPAPDPAKRVLCLGDSYTFGDEVGDAESYPAHGEHLVPGTEWINLGISSTCLTQSLQQYRKNGKKFGGKYVVIGFMTDDAKRTVNCFRSFLTPFNPYTKPFARFSGGKFSIEPNPYQKLADYERLLARPEFEIPRLASLDYMTWSNQAATTNPVMRTAEYVVEAMHLDRNVDALLNRKPRKASAKSGKGGARPEGPADNTQEAELKSRWPKDLSKMDPYGRAIWNPNSLGFTAITRLFDLYYEEIIADGRIPLIVIIPGPLDIENERKHLPRVYEALDEHFKARRVHYLDFLDSLIAHHKSDFTFEALYGHCHFRSETYHELAREIARELRLN